MFCAKIQTYQNHARESRDACERAEQDAVESENTAFESIAETPRASDSVRESRAETPSTLRAREPSRDAVDVACERAEQRRRRRRVRESKAETLLTDNAARES
ncbi:uncharacterized protein G2W53_007799 [Senna tora]|uniref:Uncharacterized protein n=1 Tax=Senna tora TaxID=362788 RepID=A0A834X705_9FABA|nr:uncharacterized protein G2W53_007799 [Senna tora]